MISAVSYNRRVRYFLKKIAVLPISAVVLYYFAFSTQQAFSNRRLRIFEIYVSKNAAEKWIEDAGVSPWLNQTEADPVAVGANESSTIDMMSTLFARLSSEVEKRIHSLFTDKNNSSSSLCPIISPKLIGRANISVAAILEEKDDVLQHDLIKNGVELGGRYEPVECRWRHKLAIVIPIRNRTEHLAVFVRYMHRFLQRQQQLSYAVFVIEQSEGSPFNRGMLMNIGYNEAQLTMEKFQCFIFHDVDLLPENDGNPYTCPEEGTARQMSYSLDYWNEYKPSPDWHFGGVTALTTADFQKVNGFSNLYWGWGGEDDDLLKRVQLQNMTVTRFLQNYPSLIHKVRYTSLSHAKAEPNPLRFQLLNEGPQRIKSDGLSNLKYKTIGIQRNLLYTYIRVDVHL